MRVHGRSKGYTLAELTVVLTVIGVLTTMALPRITDTRDRLTLEAATHEFARAFSMARSEAIRLNRNVVVKRVGNTGYLMPSGQQRTLPNGATFTTTPADSIVFASFGPPVVGAGTYQITYNGRVGRIDISAAGFVRAR